VGAALKMSKSSMSDQFDSLDATEKAAVEAGLNRCRTLVAQIQSELRNMRPEHFVNKFLLADFLRLLAGAAGVLSAVKRSRRPSRVRKKPGINSLFLLAVLTSEGAPF